MPRPFLAAGRSSKLSLLVAVLVPLAALVWSYWTTLGEAAERWALDPQYSHGYLVPGFALILLWLRRESLTSGPLRPSWWGAPLLAAGIAMRLAGTYYYFAWIDAVSLLPCVAGVCVMVGGGRTLRWSWPAIAFLIFMIPLPYRVEVMMAGPLQRMATVASTFALQTLGRPAISEGTVILLNDVSIGIVEACSGLRMLVIFFALSTAVALVIQRRFWEKLVIAASAVPIALASNILRITVTGVLHDTVGSAIANAVFHDLAGWLMMPLALGIMAVELAILKRLMIEPIFQTPPLGLGVPVAPRPLNRPRRGRRARSDQESFTAPAEPVDPGWPGKPR